MKRHHVPRTKSGAQFDTDVKILVYSISRESLEDYAQTLKHIGANFDTVNNPHDAKKMLKSGDYGILIADVTDFETSGRNLIRWAKIHIANPDFRVHGYTRTDLPGVIKRVYCRGVDQRFYFDSSDIDRLTEMLFALFLDYQDLSWIKEMNMGQKKLREQIGDGPAMENPVLLEGPKGSGKESLAEIVHGLCNRSEHEFIVLDCNPRQRFDYVHRENKDTPANRKALAENYEQLFGEAYKGTILVRSFTHLSLMAQEVLADVFEKGVCIHPESREKVKYEGRIIFTNNKSLPELVNTKKLSGRLYNMLMKNVMRIKPLAEYGKETLQMAKSIVSHLCLKSRGKTMTISKEAGNIIKNYHWSGNIFEMLEVMEIAVSTAKNLIIEPSDLSMIAPEDPEEEIVPIEPTKENIESLMRQYKGNKTKVAKMLGCSRGFLYKLLKEYCIPLNYK